MSPCFLLDLFEVDSPGLDELELLSEPFSVFLSSCPSATRTPPMRHEITVSQSGDAQKRTILNSREKMELFGTVHHNRTTRGPLVAEWIRVL